METKVCSKCGRELPLSEFHRNTRATDGLHSYCKECNRKTSKKRYDSLNSGANRFPDPGIYFDERFKDIEPRELIEELRLRGYTGELEYRQVKVFKIKL